MKLGRMLRYFEAKLLPRRKRATDVVGREIAEAMVMQDLALARQKMAVEAIPPRDEIRRLVSEALRKVEAEHA